MSLLCTYIVRWCWNAPLHFVIFNPLYQHHCKHRQDSPFVQKKNVSLEYYASLYYVYCTVQYNVHVLSRITLFDHYNHVLKLMIAYASFCLWNPIRLMWKYSFLIWGLPKIKKIGMPKTNRLKNFVYQIYDEFKVQHISAVYLNFAKCERDTFESI